MEEKEKKFYDDPKFMESLSDEQKELAKAHDEQYSKFLQNQYEDKIAEAKELGKKEALQELETKAKAKAERDQFLGSVPEANRKFISDAMDSGKDINYIKENYKGLLAQEPKEEPAKADPKPEVIDEPKENPVIVDMQSFLDGRADQIGENQKSENAESDKDFIARTKSGKNKNLLDPSSSDWAKALAILEKNKK